MSICQTSCKRCNGLRFPTSVERTGKGYWLSDISIQVAAACGTFTTGSMSCGRTFWTAGPCRSILQYINVTETWLEKTSIASYVWPATESSSDAWAARFARPIVQLATWRSRIQANQFHFEQSSSTGVTWQKFEFAYGFKSYKCDVLYKLFKFRIFGNLMESATGTKRSIFPVLLQIWGWSGFDPELIPWFFGKGNSIKFEVLVGFLVWFCSHGKSTMLMRFTGKDGDFLWLRFWGFIGFFSPSFCDSCFTRNHEWKCKMDEPRVFFRDRSSF